MTDRIHALTVVLAQDIRVDDVASLTNAIRMLKGVAKVTPLVSDAALFTAEIRAKSEVKQRLFNLIHELD